MPKFNYCLSIIFSGRLGNLMFQYAALVGTCIKKGFGPERCAFIPPSWHHMDQVSRPVAHFINSFHIPLNSVTDCRSNRKKYQEHPFDPYAVEFDEMIFQQASGTTLSGYMQSWKYFHPHAKETILSIFNTPLTNHSGANSFIKNVKYDLMQRINNRNSHPQIHLIGVHIRLGDKTTNVSLGEYDNWSLSTSYYYKAISIMKKYYNTNYPNVETALIFFSGGAFEKHKHVEDQQKVREVFNHTHKYVYFEESIDPIQSLATLGLCDNLIISASTFGWWAAYISQRPIIIAPRHIYKNSGKRFNLTDHYLSEWWLLSENANDDRIGGSKLI